MTHMMESKREGDAQRTKHNIEEVGTGKKDTRLIKAAPAIYLVAGCLHLTNNLSPYSQS